MKDEGQPISTAPKDGSVVWVINSVMKNPVLARFGKPTLMSGQSIDGFAVYSDPFDPLMPARFNGLVQPTHWRPLPEKPKDSNE